MTSGYRCIQVESPFDYQSNSKLYVPKCMTPPIYGNDDKESVRLEQEVVPEMVKLICKARGRTLSLFTSWKALKKTAPILKKQLKQLDSSFTVRPQEEGDSNPHRLIKELRENPQTVICATRSLWEGIDIPGPALTLLIIDRLPFDYPSNPLVQARSDLAKAAGENPFNQVRIPRCATSLAQALGRLIRTMSDRGVAAVMDSRLATEGYGERLLKLAPPMPRTFELSEALEFLESLD